MHEEIEVITEQRSKKRKRNKERRKHRLEIVLMLVLFIFSLEAVSFFSVHQFEDSETKVKNFFVEEKDTIDVVNIGASEIYTGFSPEYVWRNFGITSYNLATPGAPMRLAKSELQVALKRQHPKLFVISLNGVVYNDERSTDEGFTRMWLDNIPQSKERWQAIREWFPEEQRKNYYLKLSKYHTNISDPKKIKNCITLSIKQLKTMKDKNLVTLKTLSGIADTAGELKNPVDATTYTTKLPLTLKTREQLIELLDYLKEENITNVVFVNMPRYYDKQLIGTKGRINTAIDIVKAYGFDVYDFDKNLKEIGLNANSDYYNRGHLNIYGSQKMSKYFYEKIVPRYVKEKRNYSEDVRKRWDENYYAYLKVCTWIGDTMKDKSLERRYKGYSSLNIERIVEGTYNPHTDYEEVFGSGKKSVLHFGNKKGSR